MTHFLNCYCGAPAKLGSNATIYGREYGNGKAWICSTFPKCRGYVGAHPDGKPLGTIVDQETKKLRMKVHALIDPLWKNATNGRSKKRNRGSVYGWMKRIMGEGKDFHCGELSKEQCLKALELIPKNPYRRSGEWETKAAEGITTHPALVEEQKKQESEPQTSF